MPSCSSANLQGAALLVHATTAKSTVSAVTDVEEEEWQVVVPRARYKRSTTALPAGSPTTQVDTIMSQKSPGALNTFQKSGGNQIAGDKNLAGRRGEDNRGGRGGAAGSMKGFNKVYSSAKGSGGEMRRTLAVPSQLLTSTKIRPSLTFMQVIITPVKPQESTLENNENYDSAQLLADPIVQAHPSIQLDSQTGLVLQMSQASFSDKEAVDLSTSVSRLQSRSAVPDDAPHKSVVVAAAAVADLKLSVEGTPREAIVPVEAASVEDEDHKNEAVELISSSIPSSGPEEQTIIETEPVLSQSLQARSTEITIVTGSSVAIECENLDYGMSTVEEPKSVFTVRNNASEGGTERMDAAMRRLSVAIPPFQSNHGVVPFEAVLGVPAVTNWTPVTMITFMHGRGLHPQLYSFPHVVGEPIYQAATPMTMMGTQKLNPYAQEFLPSYIRDQGSTFGIMAPQHCRGTSTEPVVAAPLSSRGERSANSTQSDFSGADNNNNNDKNNGSEGQQTQGMQRKQRRRNGQRGGRGGGPSHRSLAVFFPSSY